MADGSSRTTSVTDIPQMDDKDVEAGTGSAPRTTHLDEKARPDLVEFDGPNDPDDPRNWKRLRKWSITLSMSSLNFCVTFSSSIFSTAINPVSTEYDIGTPVSTLGVSLFLLGFVFGPILFGPASEMFGRRPPMLVGFAIFAIFNIPVAVAQNVETIMLCRFIGGFFASAPLATTGGSLADMFEPVERAYAVCFFACGVFIGPVCGPIAGAFVSETQSLGWRWTSWLTLIIATFFGIISLFVTEETSPAKILQARAAKLRFETKNWALHAKADESRLDAQTVVRVMLFRPFQMIVQEPILALLTIYMSFVYGMLYLFFEAYPIAFAEVRGWSEGVSSLPFVAMLIGVIFGTLGIAYSTRTNFQRAYKAAGGKPVPEERLPPMIWAAVLLPVTLFLFAWTSSPHVHWAPQVIAGAGMGGGCLVVFWQGMNYMMDCYGFYSNSAIAANTFFRSILGAVFPLFAPYMYHNLGVNWATSLLAFLCAAFAPVPILFYIYGERIRRKSKFAPT